MKQISDTRRGYYDIADNEGKFVEEDEALEYALAQCGMRIVNPDATECEEAAVALEEWFFGQSWIFFESDKE